MLIRLQDSTGRFQDVNYDRHPDYCPICLYKILPIETNLYWLISERRLEIIFRCPRHECEHFFIARYGHRLNQFYPFSEAVPLTVKAKNFSKRIKDISQYFEDIYQQAQMAERQGLKLVCGPGYRKALEFLVKDYAIGLHPEKGAQIKKTFLGKCISDFIKNDDVKAVAERAAWLGNDETHYLRLWKDKDLEDLKDLIDLTVHWIELERGTAERLKNMPKKKST